MKTSTGPYPRNPMAPLVRSVAHSDRIPSDLSGKRTPLPGTRNSQSSPGKTSFDPLAGLSIYLP